MNPQGRHKELIEEIIKANPLYKGNELLLEVFAAEVYKKSYLLLDSASNLDNLKNYLNKVVETSIVNILKNRSEEDFEHARPKEKSLDILIDEKAKVETPKAIQADMFPKTIVKSHQKQYEIVTIKNSSQGILNADIYADIEDPALYYTDNETSSAFVKRIADFVYEIHLKYPDKLYFQLFYSRYVKGTKQANLAKQLKISQNELSKRYFEMVRLIKEKF